MDILFTGNFSDFESSGSEKNPKPERKNFKMLDTNRVIQSDDVLFLASYLRLWNFFYINSLQTE